MTSPDYKHLHPDFVHCMALSPEERIAVLDMPRWIGYSRAKEILDVLRDLMDKPKRPRMPNLLIVGDSNNGKTTLIRRFVDLHGVSYVDENGDPVRPIVLAEAPTSADEKSLYISILERFMTPYRPADPVSKLRYQLIHLMRACQVHMLIIDELHSVLTGTAAKQREVMNALKLLCNELCIPIVGVGTREAVRVLHTDPQHASRFDVAALPEWGLDFDAIDANPLSQMFKAKILSLYFPDRFLNVCSAEHLELLGIELGYGKDLPSSEYQHLLLQEKHSNRITRGWSNPKFMAFLYDIYVRTDHKPTTSVQKPRKKAAHRAVNFEDVQNQRDAIGKAAETFALAWEKERLDGVGLAQLIPKIEDRRDRPGFGYDFLSYTSPRQQRYIEVKSVGKLPNGEGHRFFLSDNEHVISMSDKHRGDYFFYLVFFDRNGQPGDLRPIRADELYQKSEISPASYVVRFNFGRSNT